MTASQVWSYNHGNRSLSWLLYQKPKRNVCSCKQTCACHSRLTQRIRFILMDVIKRTLMSSCYNPVWESCTTADLGSGLWGCSLSEDNSRIRRTRLQSGHLPSDSPGLTTFTRSGHLPLSLTALAPHKTVWILWLTCLADHLTAGVSLTISLNWKHSSKSM